MTAVASRLVERIEYYIVAARDEYPTEEVTVELGVAEFEAFEQAAIDNGETLSQIEFARGLRIIQKDQPSYLSVRVYLS